MPRRVAPTPEPWSWFLRSLDAALSEGVQVHCIGGFVVTQLYGISRETSDLDVLTTLPDPGRLAELL